MRMERKSTIWIFEVTIQGNCIQDDINMPRKGKPLERN